MGDEVKITVIATGFRDQMPERRARMLSVDEPQVVSPVSVPPVSVPLVSVPVVAPENWLREQGAAKTAPEPEPRNAPAPLRFMSDTEDQQKDEAFFFASSQPAVATTVTFAPLPQKPSADPEPAIEPMRRQFDELMQSEPRVAPERLSNPDRAANLASGPGPDFARAGSAGADSSASPRLDPRLDSRIDSRIDSRPDARPDPRIEPALPPAQGSSPEPSLFQDRGAEPERDLEVPAFLRRLNF